MKLDFIFIIGTFVGIMYTLLFPTQILGDDPTGIDGIRQDKLKNYITQNGTGYIQSINPETGEIITTNNAFEELDGIVTSTSGENAGIISTSLGFGFLDYIRMGWNLLTTALRFLLSFVVLSWSLPAPLNIAVGLPMIFLYIFGGISFIVGR